MNMNTTIFLKNCRNGAYLQGDTFLYLKHRRRINERKLGGITIIKKCIENMIR